MRMDSYGDWDEEWRCSSSNIIEFSSISGLFHVGLR
jgi:hypothetical protein